MSAEVWKTIKFSILSFIIEKFTGLKVLVTSSTGSQDIRAAPRIRQQKSISKSICLLASRHCDSKFGKLVSSWFHSQNCLQKRVPLTEITRENQDVSADHKETIRHWHSVSAYKVNASVLCSLRIFSVYASSVHTSCVHSHSEFLTLTYFCAFCICVFKCKHQNLQSSFIV